MPAFRDHGATVTITAVGALAVVSAVMKSKRGSSDRRSSHPRHHKGMVVTPARDAPKSPGPWVDETRCYACGGEYKRFRGSKGFADAADDLRRAAKAAGDEGGGFRSRGAVLWWMRVNKLDEWYLKHWPCQMIPRSEWAIDPEFIEEMRFAETNEQGMLVSSSGEPLF